MCHYQSDLEQPNPATNDRITFHLCACLKLASTVILNLTKINPLKSCKKCFLFQLNCLFGSWNMQFLGGNQEVKNGIMMTSWNRLRKLPTLIFEKTRKTLWIKRSKVFRWWTTKVKNFCTYLAILKAVPGTF